MAKIFPVWLVDGAVAENHLPEWQAGPVTLLADQGRRHHPARALTRGRAYASAGLAADEQRLVGGRSVGVEAPTVAVERGEGRRVVDPFLA